MVGATHLMLVIVMVGQLCCDVMAFATLVIAERPLTLVREAQPLYYARMYMRMWKMRWSTH